jgi:hypothetical protein
VFNDDEAIQLLRAAVKGEGNQVAFAKRHRIDRSNLNQILSGKNPLPAPFWRLSGFAKFMPAKAVR